MTRFLMDTDDGRSYVRDEVGHNLPDMQAARRLALRTLSEMARDNMGGEGRQSFRVLVRDEQGATLYVASLDLRETWRGTPEALAVQVGDEGEHLMTFAHQAIRGVGGQLPGTREA